MKKLLLTLFLSSVMLNSFSQVGIGTTSPHKYSALDIQSTTIGFFPPRLTQSDILALADTNPPDGLLVYCKNCHVEGIYIYDGTNFIHHPSLKTAMEDYSNEVLKQIAREANDQDLKSSITFTQLRLIIPPIEGIQPADQQKYQDYIDANINANGETAFSEGIAEWRQVNEMVNGFVPFEPNYCNGSETVVETIESSSGRVWMDRNLGASRAATAWDDAAAYGDYYQWGRNSDGHQCSRGGGSWTSEVSNSIIPEHGKFIKPPFNTPGYNWLNDPDKIYTNLWQGLYGDNNPCPTGFRIPTKDEWQKEWDEYGEKNKGKSVFINKFKLTSTGFRNHDSSSSADFVSTSLGYFWSSTTTTISNGLSLAALIYPNDVFFTITDEQRNGYRSRGYAIRCIKAKDGE